MLSFVDTRILLLLAVTSYLASCQCKFDYLLFFFSVMDNFFPGPTASGSCAWLFIWDVHEGQPEESAKHRWIKTQRIELMQRILHFLFFSKDTIKMIWLVSEKEQLPSWQREGEKQNFSRWSRIFRAFNACGVIKLAESEFSFRHWMENLVGRCTYCSIQMSKRWGCIIGNDSVSPWWPRVQTSSGTNSIFSSLEKKKSVCQEL